MSEGRPPITLKRIELGEIDLTKPRTVADDARDVIIRFEDQVFTARHVIKYLMDNSDFARHKTESHIKRVVRLIIKKGIKNGDLEVVEERQGINPGLYRRITDGLQKISD